MRSEVRREELLTTPRQAPYRGGSKTASRASCAVFSFVQKCSSFMYMITASYPAARIYKIATF